MSPLTVNSPLYVLLRWGAYVSITILVGSICFRLFVLGAMERDGTFRDLARFVLARLRILALTAAVALFAITCMRLVAQIAVFRAAALPGQVIDVPAVLSGIWGLGWKAEIAGTLTAMLCIALPALSRVGWHLAFVAAAGGIAVGQAFSGHAADASPMTTAVALDVVHLLSASAWIGGIVVLLATILPALAAVDESTRSPALPVLLRLFSPLALSCAAVLVLSGVYAAISRVGHVDALWTTAYGRTLLVKLGLVAVIAALGALNWRRFGPQAGEPGGAAALQRSARLELFLAAVVLALTAILVALPTPMDAS